MAAARREPARFWWATTAVAVVGLGVRLAWVAYAAHTPHGSFDPARYLKFAEQLAGGHGYVSSVSGRPTAYYPPGYPLFLGAVAAAARFTFLPGNVPLLAGVVQAILGGSMCVSAAVVGRRLWSPLAGVLGAAVVALYPNLVSHTAALLSETLYMALFLAALAVLLGGGPEGEASPGRVGGFAALFTLAVLVRPIALPLVVPIIALWWRRHRDVRRVLQLAGITMAVLVVGIGAWTVRNAVRMDALVPISTNAGDNLCMAYAPHANGGFDLTHACDVPVTDTELDGPGGEIRHDQVLERRAWHDATGHLNRLPWLLWRRVYFTYRNDHDGLAAVQSYLTDRWMPAGTYSTLVRIADVAYVVVAVLGVAGLALVATDHRRRSSFARWVFLWSVAVTAVVPLVFFGDPRFKVPVMALLGVAAGVAVAAGVEQCRRPAAPERPRAAAADPRR